MTQAIDILTIEVGSTITKVNGFARSGPGLPLVHVAQGFAPTSVAQGDVGIGVQQAKRDLLSRYAVGSPDAPAEGPRPAPGASDGASGQEGRTVEQAPTADTTDDPLAGAETFVNSSAAGGLRMTVHGLTLSMTARAAREASLGAGAIVELVTAGELSDDDLDDIRAINPNMILLAGGVDFGERSTVVRNAERLASLGLPQTPVLYAGNRAARPAIQRIFAAAGVELMLADNVFPEVDVLNVEPLRRVIHELFNAHITKARGMAALAEISDHDILPTPGAVLRGAELFADALGDVVVVDVGGATTDIHSVTDGSLEYAGLLVDPEPRAKRTVEGDLGVFVNANNILALAGDPAWAERASDLRAIPQADREVELTRWLCQRAVETGVKRHAGTISDLFTPSGKKQMVRGKDLTAVRWVVATGGALTRVAGGEDALRAVCTGAGHHLLPDRGATVLIDRDYLFSALGTLAQTYPDEVTATLRRWVADQGYAADSLDPEPLASEQREV